jgi:LAGLIDADG DNA endonuclease family protein
MGIYIYIKFDLITSVSLICKQNYTTSVNKRLTKGERSKFSIDSPLSEILIGLLLGDGHLQCRFGNSRFIYGQSSLREHHLNYFYHIFDLFKPFVSKEFKVKSRSFVDKRTKNTYSSIYFATLTLPCFTYYRNLFFNIHNTKIVPLNINQLLTPRGLAYWIMDDGSLQNKGLHLSTYNFSYEEVILLKNTLENLFKPDFLVKCSIHNHKKGYRIYIWEESIISVRNHIFQYMHKDMLYKINPK